jgi:predicted DsbA family dithiol-disulfide isomerase
MWALVTSIQAAVDPLCPWSWRVAQWLGEVRSVRSVEVKWAILSLEYLNRDQPQHPMMKRFKSNRAAMRLLGMTQGRAGDLKLEQLYWALGEAVHERGEPLDEEEVLRRALAKAGLPGQWLREAFQDKELDRELWRMYGELCSTGAFGVPTIFLGPSRVPYYGPVISRVPKGEEAGDLWDHVAGLARHEYFYELKRPR